MWPARVGHKKSRFGCVRCKQRHVKCDEQRPCHNCVRHNAHCSLILFRPREKAPRPSPQLAPGTLPSSSISPSPSDNNTAGIAETPSEQSPKTPVRSTSARARVSAIKKLVTALQDEVQALDEDLGTPGDAGTRDENKALSNGKPQRHISSADWMQSLQLLHHYCISTYATLADDPDTHHIWKVVVPQIALGHEFVMNGLLAVSALHFAYLNPEVGKAYSTISAHYQNLALDRFSSRITDIDDNNCDAYYLVAAFIFLMSMFSIAQSQGKGIALNEVSQSFVLVQGIKNIRSLPSASTWAERGQLAPTLLKPETTPTKPPDPRLQFVVRLEQLSATIQSAPMRSSDADEIRSSCLLAVDLLRHGHASVLLSTRGARRVWAWPFQLPPYFPKLIEKGNPLALVILAHFAALVRQFDEEFWFSKGWGYSVQAMVESSLDQPWKALVDWPRQCGPEDFGFRI